MNTSIEHVFFYPLAAVSASVKVRPGVPDAQILCSDAKITRAWGPRLSRNKCWTHEFVVFGVQWTHQFFASGVHVHCIL